MAAAVSVGIESNHGPSTRSAPAEVVVRPGVVEAPLLGLPPAPLASAHALVRQDHDANPHDRHPSPAADSRALASRHAEDRATVRPARLSDVPALVELRMANAEAHLALDPDVYRLPQREAVTDHFTAALPTRPPGTRSWSRSRADRWSGWSRCCACPNRPHTRSFAPSLRRRSTPWCRVRPGGAGSAPRCSTRLNRWAAEHAVSYLSAGIHHRNASAVRFYRRHGYAPAGTSLSQATQRLARATVRGATRGRLPLPFRCGHTGTADRHGTTFGTCHW